MGTTVQRVILPLLLLVLVTAPMATAQLTEPLQACARKCDPKAADVNGPEVRTGDATVKTVLYVHHEDLIKSGIINAQLPDADEPSLNSGYLMPTIDSQTGTDADLYFKFTKITGISSAGLVEITDGVWRSHQEPGVADDIELIGDTIPLYVYFSAYPLPSQNSSASPLGTNAVAAVPNLGVKATMHAGRSPGHGDVIAEGDTGTEGRINVVQLPGEDAIYEFEVLLDIKQAKLSSVHNGGPGFTLTIEPYQVRDDSAAAGWEFTQADWRFRAGPRTPTHLVVEIADPLETKNAKLAHFNNHLFVRWSLLSPWGSYDLDERSIKIEVDGPKEPDVEKSGITRPLVVRRSLDHDWHFKPMNVTWKFDYRRSGLPDGDYVVKVSALNLQGTYLLETEMPFTLKGGKPTGPGVEMIGAEGGRAQSAGSEPKGSSPGPAAALLVALPILAAWRRRREA